MLSCPAAQPCRPPARKITSVMINNPGVLGRSPHWRGAPPCPALWPRHRVRHPASRAAQAPHANLNNEDSAAAWHMIARAAAGGLELCSLQDLRQLGMHYWKRDASGTLRHQSTAGRAERAPRRRRSRTRRRRRGSASSTDPPLQLRQCIRL